jgi:hypothetical protein
MVMKALSLKTIPVHLAAVVGMVGLTISSEASEASALRKAAGVYDGTGRGSLVSTFGDGTASLPASLRVPRGAGAGSIRIDARSVGGGIYTLPVSFTKATVNATETKVTFKGQVTVPASYTEGLGTLKGGFTAVVTLRGTPKVTTNSTFTTGFATLRVAFNGSK